MRTTTETAVTILRHQLRDSRSRNRLEYSFYKICQVAYYGALVGVAYLFFFYAIPGIGSLIRSLISG